MSDYGSFSANNDNSTSCFKKRKFVVVAIVVFVIVTAAVAVPLSLVLAKVTSHKKCGNLIPTGHVRIVDGCHDGNINCTVKCASEGFWLDGNVNMAVCNLTTDHWQPTKLGCHTCPVVDFSHSKIESGCKVGNLSCEMNCNEGWFPRGVQDSICTDGTAWTPSISCTTCDPFQVPAKGKIKEGCGKGDLNCTIACDTVSAYYPNATQSFCTGGIGTKWEPTVACLTCPQVFIDHGSTSSGCLPGFPNCKYSCDNGWFQASSVSNCVNNLTYGPEWQPRAACYTCPRFVAPDNGKIVSGCHLGDTACVISCNNGFVPTQGTKSTCPNGKAWVPELKCSPPYYFLALGDWGVSNDGHASTTTHPRHDVEGTKVYNRDFNAQQFIGKIMGDWADIYKPNFVISHGDNFYWDGLFSADDDQTKISFEERYPRPSLFIPWYPVMGNHDYGGGAPLGGDGGKQALLNKLHWQTQYKSPNNDRWQFSDAYYRKHIETGMGFTIDIFNIDTNAAPIHGYDEICCQCYAQSNPCEASAGCSAAKECKTNCAPTSEVNACRQYMKDRWTESMTKLEADLQASTATWRIINSHYGPRLHMSQPQKNEIYGIMEKYHVHLYMYGHTHGEGHEYNPDVKTHFLLNGAGGGYQAAGAKLDEWSATIYAFISIMGTADELTVEFVGFDDSTWGDYSAGSSGTYKVTHCWIVPQDGGEGKLCPTTKKKDNTMMGIFYNLATLYSYVNKNN